MKSQAQTSLDTFPPFFFLFVNKSGARELGKLQIDDSNLPVFNLSNLSALHFFKGIILSVLFLNVALF